MGYGWEGGLSSIDISSLRDFFPTDSFGGDMFIDRIEKPYGVVLAFFALSINISLLTE
jgi:hypothetical protein